MRVFVEQSWLAFKALYGWLDPKVYVLTNVASPVLGLVFFGLVARYARGGDPTWAVLGNTIVFVAFTGIFGTATLLSSDRGAGTLPLIIASPRGKFYVFAGRSLFYVANGIVTVAIGLVTGRLVFRLDFSGASPGWMAMAALACIVSVTAAGLAIGAVGLVARDLNLILNLALVGFMALSGINFPVTELPAWAQVIGRGLPITRGLAAFRMAFGHEGEAVAGRVTASIGGLVLGELALALAYVAAGYLLFLWLERRARLEGKFDFQA